MVSVARLWPAATGGGPTSIVASARTGAWRERGCLGGDVVPGWERGRWLTCPSMAAKSRAKDRARRARRKVAATGDATDEGRRPGRATSGTATTAEKRGGARPRSRSRPAGGRATAPGHGRHTPPVPKKVRTSPRWMGVAIIVSFVVGALVVILDYAGLLPGGVNNAWLLAAIAAIFVGLLLATRYH